MTIRRHKGNTNLLFWPVILLLLTVVLAGCSNTNAPGTSDAEGSGSQPNETGASNEGANGNGAGNEETDGAKPNNEHVNSEVKAVRDSYLHFRLPEGSEFPLIGDVHPFYDSKSQTWYMFYLDTSGQFNTKLLTSKDAISWEPRELTFSSNLANYPVLGVLESEGRYYSYYAEYIPSVSDDLQTWHYGGLSYMAPQDLKQFPGGMRDPHVAYDADSKRYYSIGLSYPKRVASENTYISNLALNRSSGDSLTSWESEHRAVFAENFESNDPEVPQLVKMSDRWYIITSIFGKTQHGVGPTSYLIGDPGKNPFEVDWQSKELHTLTTEDLAAAQIVDAEGTYLLFGWIPNDYTGNTWGGDINLALEVYPLADGTLRTRMYDGISDLIRGERSFALEAAAAVAPEAKLTVPTVKRMDMAMQLRAEGSSVKVRFEDKDVELILHRTETGSYAEIKSNTFVVSALPLAPDLFADDISLRLIAEGNMLEVFVNDAYTLHARVGVNFGQDTVAVSVPDGKAEVKELAVYHLKFREQLTNEGVKR